jgi:glutamate synthase (NADPH) small chain
VTAGNGDLSAYLQASSTLESSRTQVETLEHSQPVESFNHQLDLLKRRLINEPRAFRDIFISDGMAAVAYEFGQDELSESFVKTLWAMMLRGDDASTVLMRFIWALPLGMKRKFIRGIDAHLSEQYPMFEGLSNNWPSGSWIPPYIREADDRAHDFGLVNEGSATPRATSTCSSGSRFCATSSVTTSHASSAPSSPAAASPRAAARCRSTSRR